MMRLRSDLVTLILEALAGNLHNVTAVWDERPAIGVVMTAGGYPNTYQTGAVIEGLEKITDSDVKIFHAGTKQDQGKIITDGGRVLTVTALGNNFKEAQQKVYAAIKHIHWSNCHYRHDIGKR